jgi:hypothetical protein
LLHHIVFELFSLSYLIKLSKKQLFQTYAIKGQALSINLLEPHTNLETCFSESTMPDVPKNRTVAKYKIVPSEIFSVALICLPLT